MCDVDIFQINELHQKNILNLVFSDTLEHSPTWSIL